MLSEAGLSRRTLEEFSQPCNEYLTMKLELRHTQNHSYKVLLLTDSHGIPLPNQKAVRVDFSVDELPRVIVEFIVDGIYISSKPELSANVENSTSVPSDS